MIKAREANDASSILMLDGNDGRQTGNSVRLRNGIDQVIAGIAGNALTATQIIWWEAVIVVVRSQGGRRQPWRWEAVVMVGYSQGGGRQPGWWEATVVVGGSQGGRRQPCWW